MFIKQNVSKVEIKNRKYNIKCKRMEERGQAVHPVNINSSFPRLHYQQSIRDEIKSVLSFSFF